QIRVAAGDPLGYSQETFQYRGWAIECRISAEDPAHGFVPSVGTIAFSREPAGPGIRVESALYDGYTVSEFYDPLVAKVTAWGRDRREAIRRMRRALYEFKIVGVRTNLPFHLAVMEDSRFLAGELDTNFLARELRPAPPAQGGAEQAALAIAGLLRYQQQQASRNHNDGQNRSTTSGWTSARRSAVSGGMNGGKGWRRPTG
ncbi:MAG: hypothetical protein ACYDCQ_21370, partial [Dehalococcoidia bacterium]